MATARSYGDACRFAHALDVLGERWGLLVVRELLLGPKRFTDLREGLPGASPNVLSQRLRELERAGVLERRKLGPPTRARVYELTAWGAELGPILTQLGRWGDRSPFPPTAESISADAAVLALRSLFDPATAAGIEASYELQLGEQCFCVTVGGGSIELRRGHAENPLAAISAEPATLAALAAHQYDLADALRKDDVQIVGGRRAATQFLGLFSPPQRAPAPVSSLPG